MQNKLLYYQAVLSDSDFYKISVFVEQNYGIRLPRSKKAMVQNRLYKRLISTEITTFEEYVNFVLGPAGKFEQAAMIDEITTNKTNFFRENKHFIFFENEILKKKKHLKVWSAGCATGEEVYSIAMLLKENNIKYDIIATDLSSKVLKIAKQGVYDRHAAEEIPSYLLGKYFERVKEGKKDFYKAKDFLKQNIKFFKLNFKDNYYNISNDFDVIFFRNVLIYFNLQIQVEVLTKIIKHLKEGGYLFIGHAEAIYNKKLPLISVKPSVYIKTNKNERNT